MSQQVLSFVSPHLLAARGTFFATELLKYWLLLEQKQGTAKQYVLDAALVGIDTDPFPPQLGPVRISGWL